MACAASKRLLSRVSTKRLAGLNLGQDSYEEGSEESWKV